MTRMQIRNEHDLGIYLEPSLIVSRDGHVQAFNRVAELTLRRAAVGCSLFDLCDSPPDTLRQYLAHCSRPGPPSSARLTFFGHDDVSEFQCSGGVLATRYGDHEPTILLRLFSTHDETVVAGHDQATETVGQHALRQIEDLQRDRKRLGERLALMAEALRVVEEQKREIHAEVKFIRADERERIARDIHDQVGHEMAEVLAEVRRLRDDALGVERDRLEAVAAHVSDVGRRLHRAVIGGRPRIVEELGLARAIQVTVVSFAADGGLDSSFESNGAAPEILPAPVESALYRIAQEAMTNVMKHAPGARTLKVTLAFSIELISLTIADDGPGFLMESLDYGGRDDHGIGLRGMQQRMRDVGGTLTIDAYPGAGTTITASVPLGSPPEQMSTS